MAVSLPGRREGSAIFELKGRGPKMRGIAPDPGSARPAQYMCGGSS
jgi:hypothetical protein